ncbi:hypothetical protein ACFLXY_08555 [Chloroflexota bacterium]
MVLSKKEIMDYAEQVVDGFNLDPALVEHLLQFSQSIGEDIWAVIEVVLLDYYAKKSAEAQYWGVPPTLGRPFQWHVSDNEKILIRGRELYDSLLKSYTWDCKREDEHNKQQIPPQLRELLDQDQRYQK